MNFKISIASGKGGTGKTTVAVTLFELLGQKYPGQTQLIDCDVEEPNDLIFFPGIEKTQEQNVNQLIPEIDPEKCTYCRKCSEFCEFNAITILPSVPFAEVNHSLCHSCGACIEACEYNSINEHGYPVGKISKYITHKNFLLEGKLKIGSAMQTFLIRELKKNSEKDAVISIYDAPPGTSCPVVETVSETNFIVLVTEPTPFGLYDLKLSIEMLQEINIPFGIVINKSGIGNREVYAYIKENKLNLLGEISFSRDYAAMYSRGELIRHIPPEIKKQYNVIVSNLLKYMESE